MKTVALGIAALAMAALGVVPEAHACGVKLLVKGPKVAQRSSYPTTVHVVGSEKTKMVSQALKRAGHKVVVTQKVERLKNDDRVVVLADPAEANGLKEKLPGAVVLPLHANVNQSVKQLEMELSKRAAADKLQKQAPQG